MDILLTKKLYFGKQVRMTKNSINETAAYASRKAESALMALNLHSVIVNTYLVYKIDPKSGTQTKKFRR